MSRQARTARGWVAALGSALAVALAVTGAVTGAVAGAATGTPGPDSAVVHAVSGSAQRAARAYWVPSRMLAATPLPGVPAAGSPPGAPPGIPSPRQFDGVPTVGALFFTTGTQEHFCTASVVSSKHENLVLTAAHCVYGSTYVSNIEFIPRYHDGKQPYGAWPVKVIVVAAGWQQSHDPNLDFAFLAVVPPAGVTQPIQQVTGGLQLGIRLGYDHPIEVIGYNDSGDKPIKCATKSFKFAPHQMKFYCNDYQTGTSGGPWIIGYQNHTGTGTVFGVIGGYQLGGDHAWSSYSAYFGGPARRLFEQAESQ
jgi:V8-like Glu-specific endopeptidase